MRSARRLCLVLTLPLAATSAAAQGGPPGASVGVPPNPFASNYPSAPPSRYDRPDGYEEVERPRRTVRPRRAVRAEPRGLRPPADIPGR